MQTQSAWQQRHAALPTQTPCRLQYKGYNRRQTRVCLSVCLSVGVIKEHTHTHTHGQTRGNAAAGWCWGLHAKCVITE